MVIITYDTIKVTLHSKLLQGHCTEFEFDDVRINLSRTTSERVTFLTPDEMLSVM